MQTHLADRETLFAYLDSLQAAAPGDHAAPSCRWVRRASDAELISLFQALPGHLGPQERPRVDAQLKQLFAHAEHRLRKQDRQRPPHEALRKAIVALYAHLGAGSVSRAGVLKLLAHLRSKQDLAELAELIVNDPPAGGELVLAPLLQHDDYDVSAIFPRLFDALQHVALAAVIVDLANFLSRENRVAEHPGKTRCERLRALLGSLAQQLGQLEERRGEPGAVEPDIATVESLIALTISLCDALALLDDRQGIGKLYQALELRHRRIRVEAAAALAKLGEEAGAKALAELAAEPIARSRVLQYAEEIGCRDQLDEQHTTPQALAEAQFVTWLAAPEHFGAPPRTCELYDSRTLSWPSYEAPVECFLFRFVYQAGGGEYANIGWAGPETHALTADLSDLPPEKIYAAYAGWQVEHPEIVRKDISRLTADDKIWVGRAVGRLTAAGYEQVAPVFLAAFFGEPFLVVQAERSGPGVAVVDEQHISWQPHQDKKHPLGPQEAYYLYIGEKLLQAFNT